MTASRFLSLALARVRVPARRTPPPAARLLPPAATAAAAAVFALVVAAGCGSSPPPRWVLDHPTDPAYPLDDFFVGLGRADDRPNAETLARAEISHSLGTRVQSVLEQLESETLIDGTERRSLRHVESYNRAVSEERLLGTRVVAHWEDLRRGEVYVKVVLDRDRAVSQYWADAVEAAERADSLRPTGAESPAEALLRELATTGALRHALSSLAILDAVAKDDTPLPPELPDTRRRVLDRLLAVETRARSRLRSVRLRVASGDRQEADTRGRLAEPLRVIAELDGRPLPGAPIEFVADGDGARLEGASRTTDSDGAATCRVAASAPDGRREHHVTARLDLSRFDLPAGALDAPSTRATYLLPSLEDAAVAVHVPIESAASRNRNPLEVRLSALLLARGARLVSPSPATRAAIGDTDASTLSRRLQPSVRYILRGRSQTSNLGTQVNVCFVEAGCTLEWIDTSSGQVLWRQAWPPSGDYKAGANTCESAATQALTKLGDAVTTALSRELDDRFGTTVTGS